MSRLLDRLREALRPDYEVERELARGGMGVVFLARDVVLDRSVAVKVVRPEIATARTREQFLREAKLLAKLSHPNAVPIHRAGEAGGLLYYVMEHVQGDTLSLRIARGPLPPREVVKIGRDVLDALEAVHALGVVHRDIKPENIFLVGGRAMLADFGIAAEAVPAPPRAAKSARPVGTPGYIAPEQWTTGAVTPQTDLYALGVTLSEAFAGRRWDASDAERDADWVWVPRRYQRLLRRAVQFDPKDRWPDAASFRRALWRTRRRAVRVLVTTVAVAGVLAGAAAAALLFPTPGPPRTEVALYRFTVRGGLDSEWDVHIPRLIEPNLAVLDYMPINTLMRAYPGPIADTAAWLQQVNADALVTGTVEPEGERLRVTVVVTSRDGRRAAAPVVVDRAEMNSAGCKLASQIVGLVAPARLMGEFSCSLALEGTTAEAVTHWLEGERAFFQQDWGGAARHYREALAVDSAFALPRWRLVIAQNWLRTGPGVDLDQFYRDAGDRLPDPDRLLLDAMRTPLGPARYAKFAAATERFPRHTYPWLLYGDDLLHRGPLVGWATDSAARILSVATRIDSSLSPAYMQLAWALIKLGRREAAADAVNRLVAVADPLAVVPPGFFRLAYFERFAPDSARPLRAALLGGGQWGPLTQLFLDRGVRWGLSFNVPRTQLEIAGAMLAMDGVPSAARARAFIARGAALVRLGHIEEALAAFDSVAAIAAGPESRLVRAQWPVFLSALGMVRPDTAELTRSRVTLAGLADLDHLDPSDSLAPRAAWTLAIDALARDDSTAYAEWRGRLGSAGGGGDTLLGRMADAWRAARAGAPDEALRLSAPMVGLVARDVSDPFLRVTLYLKRGEWLAPGDRARAAAAWMWHQHSDAVGWLDGGLQAAEVDWAFATFAYYLAATLADRRPEACTWHAAVADWWRAADPALRVRAYEAQTFAEERCRT